MPEKNIFTHQVRIYYEDTDFSGVVYHAAYLKFFERGRTEALRSAGVTHKDLLNRPEPLVFTLRKMTTEWIAPARIDDLLTVQSEFTGVKGARMLLAQAIFRDETLIARATLEVVCMTREGRARRLPREIRDRFDLS